ncbi:MAG: methyltransferase [Methanosarcinales archaeon]|nr:methyltransferase [Methanosarcinales archaeon]
MPRIEPFEPSIHSDREQIYSPAEDTRLLLKAALQEVGPGDRVLEIGCGRALISRELSLKARLVVATDVNPHATRMARSLGLETIRADLFRGIRARYDLVVFNPPYLPTAPEERSPGWINYALDGGESGRETIIRFLEGLPEHLSPGGRALLLVSSHCEIPRVIEAADRAGLGAQVVDRERFFFEELQVLKIHKL